MVGVVKPQDYPQDLECAEYVEPFLAEVERVKDKRLFDFLRDELEALADDDRAPTSTRNKVKRTT